MKTTVGVLAIIFSFIAFLQSLALGTLSDLVGLDREGITGNIGLVSSVFLFFGGAFTFSTPRAAGMLFALSVFYANQAYLRGFDDMVLWAIATCCLGWLLFWKEDNNFTYAYLAACFVSILVYYVPFFVPIWIVFLLGMTLYFIFGKNASG